MNCTTCGKWRGAHATLPGHPTDHLCHCPAPVGAGALSQVAKELAHITQPMTAEQIAEEYLGREYGAELLLQHALLALARSMQGNPSLMQEMKNTAEAASQELAPDAGAWARELEQSAAYNLLMAGCTLRRTKSADGSKDVWQVTNRFGTTTYHEQLVQLIAAAAAQRVVTRGANPAARSVTTG